MIEVNDIETLSAMDEVRSLEGLVKVPDYIYRKGPGLSRTNLVELLRSPSHFRASLVRKESFSPALNFGIALHCAVLDPLEVFYEKFCDAFVGDRRTKQGKEDYNHWKVLNTGRIPLSQDDRTNIGHMSDNLRSHPELKSYLKNGHKEISAYSYDRILGILQKVRADIWSNDGTIIDVKTTQSASNNDFMKSVVNFNYHIQAAYYSDVFSEASKIKTKRFLIAAVEKEAPYAVKMFELDDEFLEVGRKAYKKALLNYATARDTNSWTAYSEEIDILKFPSWGNRYE